MFKPQRVIFETGALDYELGRSLHDHFRSLGIEINQCAINRVKSYIPGEDARSHYSHAKQTLVVGVKKSLTFQSCKPSAHYQLPLVSGCIGQCEYCYLNTQLGDKPFIRVYVNIDDILNKADKYIKERLPENTIFEGAATSDPVPVEPYTGALEASINFFAKQNNARFRFVTKFTDIDSLLDLDHNKHTEIRFSVNTQSIISVYEHRTASADKRIEAVGKASKSGYPVGFLIAPVFLYEDWKQDYKDLLLKLRNTVDVNTTNNTSFEIITHRYTEKAKNRILEIFPDTTLDMINENRKFKFGQFGYGKYVYPKESLDEVKEFFTMEINQLFGEGTIKYII
ncbi:spore photoproduct lyase [Ruminiclostridium cellulolyticum]|uniref:Radical SAM domain protein n=1 Tax=Ruminiclostridium cellulolyticum (strain ATCC 35319 / DSM 5812 / JCM 6584 / H10) TaxID=394503 RepID=B8I781_RUMCH|nr:spore photoproduct lyase [Ruminiclostridium cellulolyticum]ACL75005.1 Radical SAM domain protein [Ruminiclostridium cellulolyticum H10]